MISLSDGACVFDLVGGGILPFTIQLSYDIYLVPFVVRGVNTYQTISRRFPSLSIYCNELSSVAARISNTTDIARGVELLLGTGGLGVRDL